MPAPTVRLLHVAQPTTAGVARCVAGLAAAQLDQGLDVSVACPPGGTLAQDLRAAGVTVYLWPAERTPGPGTPGELRRLSGLLQAVRPDVVHLHSAKAGLVGRLALRGRLPTVFQPHAWSFDAAQGAVRRATITWERAAGRWTSLLLCVSQAESEHGRAAGVRVPRTAVVPNGVDLVRLRPVDAAGRAAARAALGLPAHAPLAVCPGRLTRQKGQDVLLSAWPRVRDRVADAELVLVGDGPDEQALRRAAGEGTRLVGQQQDVAAWLAAADVVVVPSRWEGMALVPLEAMASGRSVVASDVIGMRESVPSGAGALVPSGDPRALAEAVVARLGGGTDADTEGRAGRAHVERAHDLRVTNDLITSACLALVSQSSAAN